jgi:hypothetical protein
VDETIRVSLSVYGTSGRIGPILTKFPVSGTGSPLISAATCSIFLELGMLA